MKGTVILISMVHWHFTWQYEQSLAKGLAERGYQVYFIEPMPKRWPRVNEFGRVWGRLTGRSEAAGICQQPLVPGVEILSPRMLPDAGSLPRWVNRRLFLPGLKNKLKDSTQRPLIVINDLPIPASLELMNNLEPDVSFYNCLTDWSSDPYMPIHGLERELAEAVDMVWANSQANVVRVSGMNEAVVQLPPDVDIALFSTARKDPGLPPSRPLCAYFGSISLSTDIDLLRMVSHQYPLRLIGPLRTTLDGFSDETEVIGPVPHHQLPDLLRDVDVLLLPYVHSTHNASVMPAKLYECLATGKPIIASGLKSLYDYADLFYIRETPKAFLEAIAEAVHEPAECREQRIASAEEHSFDRRMDKIEGYIQQVLDQKNRTSEEREPAYYGKISAPSSSGRK